MRKILAITVVFAIILAQELTAKLDTEDLEFLRLFYDTNTNVKKIQNQMAEGAELLRDGKISELEGAVLFKRLKDRFDEEVLIRAC